MLSLWIAISIFLSGVIAGNSLAESEHKIHKIVYHINIADREKQLSAIRNIHAHLNLLGPETLDLIVVLHGGGLSMLLYPSASKELKTYENGHADDDMQAQIDGLRNEGIQFRIGKISADRRHIDINEHLYNVAAEDIVNSGVGELTRLQVAGYTYIKP